MPIQTSYKPAALAEQHFHTHHRIPASPAGKAFQVGSVREEHHDEPRLPLANQLNTGQCRGTVHDQRPQQLHSAVEHEPSHSTCGEAGEDAQGVCIINPLDFEPALAEMKRQWNDIG